MVFIWCSVIPKNFGYDADWIMLTELVSSNLDAWANVFSALALSGALTGAIGGGEKNEEDESLRREVWKDASRAWLPCENTGWSEKVEELAKRGITLSALLKSWQNGASH